MSEQNYKKVIELYEDAISRFMRGAEWNDDEKITKVFRNYYEALYSQIHLVLVPQNDVKGEKEIRDIIGANVIGRLSQKSKKARIGVLTPLISKIEQLTKKSKKVKEEFLARYLDLYDDFLALAAFRSFKHFALYIERDLTKHDDVQKGAGGDRRIVKNTMPLFEGWYAYANKMVLDGDVKFIGKQMPTSYGKSYSDVLLISYIFGVDINNDVIKVFGNPYNCDRCFESITDIMSRPVYAKIFPYYSKFNCDVRLIFEKCSSRDGTFKISGSKMPINFLCVGKDSKISGVRGKYIFLDDITQAEDADIIRRHEEDIAKYNTVWKKRTYGKNNCYFVVGGTAYSIYDLLSYLKRKFGFGDAVPSKFNKYTSLAKSNEIVENGISVFIIIPKLDYVTDESTYPQEFDTDTARKERRENYESFMAMEQQTPVPPKNTPFYYTNLREYTDLPPVGEQGRTPYCFATLDGKRKGADFCAMPIITKIGDEHFLVDGLYEQKPMDECYGDIVSKIIQHNVTHLVLESNINEGLVTILNQKLHEHGYFSCKIEEIFHYEKKEERIASCETLIRTKIIFPQFGMYSPSSPLGAALQEIYVYSYKKKAEHDDFIDALSTYARHFIAQKTNNYATMSTFGR